MFQVVVRLDDLLFRVLIKHGAERVILCEMCFSEVSVWMHSYPGRACSVMVQCAIEECFARWWCHLSAVCISRGLYLFPYSHRLYSNRCLSRRLRVRRGDAELWG